MLVHFYKISLILVLPVYITLIQNKGNLKDLCSAKNYEIVLTEEISDIKQ